MDIVILDGHVANPGDLSWDAIASQGSLTVYDRTAPADVVARAGRAEALFVNKVVLTADIIDRLPHLRFIGELATGYNNIDIEAARRRGIVVSNVPAYSGDSVAQTVFALLLELTNRVGRYDASVRAGAWTSCADFSYTLGPITELAGLTMGIYGLGNIGSKVAAVAHALGMRVVSSTSKDADAIAPYVEKVSFDEMVARADVISVNAPLTAANRGLFSGAVFRRMKPTALLINTARGPIVDEQALAEALRTGEIAGAGLDVLASEPPAADCLLTAPDLADRCVVTPHVAWQSVAARRRLIDISASNLTAFLAGSPANVVS